MFLNILFISLHYKIFIYVNNINIMANNMKKVVTNGFILYFSIIIAYVLFFILVFYLKNTLNDIHDAYTIAINLIVIINLNIMSVVFINRFNKLKRKIDYLTYVLEPENEDDEEK
jgi:hypothetical protein